MTSRVHTPQETTERANYACPGANLILRADAAQEEWLEVRKQGIGGSDVSSIVGLNRWGSAYETWSVKRGYSDGPAYNHAMRMGHLLEPVIRTLFVEDTGIKVRQAGLMRSKEHPFMQCTVDGLTPDGGIFEAKSSTGWLREEWEDGQVPDHAELQVMHNLAVTGRSHGWISGLLDGREFFTRRIDRDEELIAELIEIERRFWEQNVLADVAPEVTNVTLPHLKDTFAQAADSATLQPRELVVDLRERLAKAKATIKDAEKEKDQVEAEFRLLFGEHNKIQDEADGATTLATLNQNGNFAPAKFKEAEPELFEQLQVMKPTLDMDTLKSDHPETYNKYRARVLRTPAIKEGK